MSKPSVNTAGRESRLQGFSYQAKSYAPKIAYALFRYAFIIGMAYVLLYPILIMATRAIRPAEDMTNPSIIWIPSGITYENLQIAWKLVQYPATVLFTSRVVVISTILSLISCSMAGYALARYKMKLAPILMGLAILTIIVPIQTYIIPLFTQTRFFSPFSISTFIASFGDWTGLYEVALGDISINLTNTEWCYYVSAAMGMGLRSGLFIVVFMQFFKGMPKELEDAARVDGCSELRTFVQVMVPNAGAPFLVVTLFSIVWYWNDYYYAQMMMSGQSMFATKISILKRMVAKSSEVATTDSGLGETVVVFAGCLLFIIPPLLLYLYLQKYFVQSIERTGIVG